MKDLKFIVYKLYSENHATQKILMDEWMESLEGRRKRETGRDRDREREKMNGDRESEGEWQ